MVSTTGQPEYPPHQKILPPELGRFSLPGKDLLVGFLNRKNNLQIKVDQLEVRGDPIPRSDDGETLLKVKFLPPFEHPAHSAVAELLYYRISIAEQLMGMSISVYVSAHDKTSLLDAIFEQAGLYLEPDLVDIDELDQDIETSAPNQQLNGFAPDQSADPEEEPLNPPALQNKTYLVTISPKHLMFYGSFELKTREALRTAPKDIDSLLDLRRWYATNPGDRYPIDLIIPGGELCLGDIPDVKAVRQWESELYKIKTGAIFGNTADSLPAVEVILSALTGVTWINENRFADYNLMHAKVIYNGRVSAANSFPDPSYSYVLAIELAGMCTNVSGILKIGYRYSVLQPYRSDVDPSAIPPIIQQ